MLNLIKVEFHKLKTSKMFYLSLLLILGQDIMIYSFSKVLRSTSGKEIILYVMSFQQISLMILMTLFASEYVLNEFTHGYIKNLVSYGHRRKNIFLSKGIAYYIGTTIISFISPILMCIINTVINGYGEGFSFSSVFFLLRIAAIMLSVYTVTASITFFIAFSSKSVSITLLVIAAIQFTTKLIIPIYVTETPMLKTIFEKTLLYQYDALYLDKNAVQVIIISLVEIAIINLAGIYIFKKTDIK